MTAAMPWSAPARRQNARIPFQTDQPFAKISTPIFTSPDGRKHHVEVLGDGQQIVVFGRHPEAGTEYTWHGGEPGSVTRDALPYINSALAAEYINKCTDYMRQHPGSVTEENKNAKAPQPAAFDGLDFDELYRGREQKYARVALDGCVSELADTVEGCRNEKLNAIAFRMGTMIARNWIDEKIVIDALLRACEANQYLMEHGQQRHDENH